MARGLIHGIFTRNGGISSIPWSSLNMGGTVGDDPDRVSRNRRLALEALKLGTESIFDAWQVHGTTIAVADKPRMVEEKHQKADILLTNQPGVTLFMRFADCTPILLFDPQKRVIGLVHAGWKGTVDGAVTAAVAEMEKRFGCKPMEIFAGIGPSIGPDHYEVGEDVVTQVKNSFIETNLILQVTRDGRIYFNLWEANRVLLEKCGVQNIEIAGICTACKLSDWYSHRMEKGKTGRFGVFAALESSNGW